MSRRLAHTSDHDVRAGASAPAWAKFAVGGGTLAVVLGAVYLMAVRGEALLVDLSALAGRIWCF
ncbi:MAG: hypothetical protein ACKVP3_20270 [Hyphomicrobiaceae bacterium]